MFSQSNFLSPAFSCIYLQLIRVQQVRLCLSHASHASVRLPPTVTSSFVVRIASADRSISRMATGWTGACREEVILLKYPVRAYRDMLYSCEYKNVLMHIKLCVQEIIDTY